MVLGERTIMMFINKIINLLFKKGDAEDRVADRESLSQELNAVILCIADTHGTLKIEQVKKIVNVDYDACFLLGDVSYKDLDLLDGILVKEKTYGLLGNHDDFGLLEKFGINNLHGEKIKINNVSFLGFEGSNRYKEGKYPMYTQEEADSILKEYPDTEVFVSHDGSYGVMGRTDPAHCGFKAITQYIRDNDVLWHIHGHCHEPKVYEVNDSKTKCVCVYKCALIDLKGEKIEFLF